jgi:hypothetical protein
MRLTRSSPSAGPPVIDQPMRAAVAVAGRPRRRPVVRHRDVLKRGPDTYLGYGLLVGAYGADVNRCEA